MRSIAVLTVVSLLLAGGILAHADDGSAPWPGNMSGGLSSDPQPQMESDVIGCAAICLAGNCTETRLIECACSGGQVKCRYYGCVSNPWWMIWWPCDCEYYIVSTGLPCTPGDPVPEVAYQERFSERE